MKLSFRYTLGTLLLLLVGVLPIRATPVDEIFVAVNTGYADASGYVDAYLSTGAEVLPILIRNLVEPTALAASGYSLFVEGTTAPGVISEFTTAGALVNPEFINDLSGPTGMTVSGSDLFLANANGTISEYTTSGALVNAALVSGLSIYPDFSAGIAVSGPDLFVTNSNSDTIGEYTTSGATVNASLISIQTPIGIVAIGSDLFIVNIDGKVSEYTTSGVLVTSSFAGINGAAAIATDGSNLFVAYGPEPVIDGATFTIGEYTTSGAALNASLFSVSDPYGEPNIAIGSPTPEPSTLLLVLAGLFAAAVRIALRRRRSKCREAMGTPCPAASELLDQALVAMAMCGPRSQNRGNAPSA